MNAEERRRHIRELLANRAITREQFLLARNANALLTCIDHLVPDDVIHYAVEDARRAAYQLLRNVDTIRTHDHHEGPEQ